MNLPSLSVILPNYNHADCLPVAVNALLKQSAQPLEIIIIDDGSTDNSVEIIEGFARKNPNIRLYRNEKNQGVIYSVLRALDLAGGDYIGFAASDDEVVPGFFEKSLRLLAQYPQAGLCCTIGDWREVSTGLNWHVGVGIADSPCYLSPAEMVNLERQSRFDIATHSAIIKRSALLEVGMFMPELKSAADWFTTYVIAFRYGVCFVPEPLAIAYIHPNSYYKRTRGDERSYRGALEHIMKLLIQPKYQDAAELIRQGGSLYIHGMPMLRVLLSKPEYRRFLNFPFLWKCLWHGTKVFLKKFTPTPLGNLYFKISGYRARTAATAPTK